MQGRRKHFPIRQASSRGLSLVRMSQGQGVDKPLDERIVPHLEGSGGMLPEKNV